MACNAVCGEDSITLWKWIGEPWKSMETEIFPNMAGDGICDDCMMDHDSTEEWLCQQLKELNFRRYNEKS